MRRWRIPITAILGLALVIAGVAAVAQDVDAVPDPQDDILLAEVTEDQSGGPLAGRLVTFLIELAEEPLCTTETPLPHIYGFLLDADRDPTTMAGPSDPAWDDLGVDARIAIDCDPTGEWVQFGGLPFEIGETTDGTWTITFTLPLEALPAPAPLWVAFAQDETDFWRTPDKPDVGAFAPALADMP